MPGINDDPKQVEEILHRCTEAGARSVGGIALHLRGETRGVFMDWLKSYRPDLVGRYEELYARGAYMPTREKHRLSGMLRRSSSWRDDGAVEQPDAPARPLSGHGRDQIERALSAPRPRQARLF